MVRKHLTPKGDERFCRCGSWIEFFSDEEERKFKVNNADFCCHRFCPVCMWRQARRDAMKIAVMMDYLEQEKGRAFVFATFTAKNVTGAELPAQVDRFNVAFRNLVKREDIMRMNDGYIRKLEITYNGDERITQEYYVKAKGYCRRRGLKVGDVNPNYDTYHPHFHVIFSVTRGYFSGGRYVKRDTWLRHWRELMGDDGITMLDVRKVQRGDVREASGEFDMKGTDTNGKGKRKSVRDTRFEIAKYAAKDADFMQSQSVFDVFYKSLHGRQLLTYGGCFKDANLLYKKKELDHYKTEDTTEYIYLIFYRWASEYVEQKRRLIDGAEYYELKKSALDESPM